MLNYQSFRSLLILFLLISVVPRTIFAHHTVETKTNIHIAVQAFLGKEDARKKWQPTIDYLNKELSNYVFDLVVIEAPNVALLRSLVDQDEVDYVIAQPIATVELQYLYGTNPELTKLDKSGESVFGSVIFTSSNSKSINTLNDLKGHTFAGANPVGLGGWILGYDHLMLNDINPYDEFSIVEFLGRQDNIVDAVINGLIDAGVVRTGVIENMIAQQRIERDEIKVLDSKTDFPYLLTTGLVPEWSFSSTMQTDTELTQIIKEKLLSFNSGYYANKMTGWTTAADYKPMHNLLKKHRLSIYQEPTYVELYKKYYPQILSFIVFVLLIFLSFKLIRNRQINKYKAELEKLSRVSSVNQLLSEIAHEISQPITSLKIDAHLVTKMLNNPNKVSNSQISEIVEHMTNKTDHCADVINNIRNFLSTKETSKELVNVNSRITKVIKLVNTELTKYKISVILQLEESGTFPLVVNVCPVELDQVLLNLCKNAISAMSETDTANVLTFTSFIDTDQVCIIVKDTGPGVSNQDELFALFKSTKQNSDTEGLGLGLSLSRKIIRAYEGDLALHSTSVNGAEFIIKIPRVSYAAE